MERATNSLAWISVSHSQESGHQSLEWACRYPARILGNKQCNAMLRSDTRDSNVWIHLRLSAGVVKRIINVIVSGVSRHYSQCRQLFPSDSRLR